MTRVIAIAAFVLTAVFVGFGSAGHPVSWSATDFILLQASSAPAGANQQSDVIPVQLSKSLDSRKLKAGDPIEAKITVELRAPDGTIIPRGSRVTGHVTEASSRAKGDAQSSLGIVFDQFVLKDGKSIPLKANIQAVGPPPNFAPGPTAMGSPSPTPTTGAHGPMGGAAPPGGLAPPPSSFPGSASGGPQPSPSSRGQQTSGELPLDTTGVVGIHGLEMGPSSTLTSGGKQVKLESGSQILLRVQNQ